MSIRISTSSATLLGTAAGRYLALLEQKTRALDQAAPLAGWQLPECFRQLRHPLEAGFKKHGSREYVQVLRLMEIFAINEATHAIEVALKLGTISFDAVRHLLLCPIERRPPRLDNYPYFKPALMSVDTGLVLADDFPEMVAAGKLRAETTL